MKPIERIAFVVNANKPGAQALGDVLVAACDSIGVKSKLTTDYPVTKGFLEGMDACCVLGGDGTLLSAVPESMAHRVPVFGINQGKLGFLAIFSVEEAQRQFQSLLEGRYKVEERHALHCIAVDGSEAIALNDLVIKSPNTLGLIGLRVTCNEELVTDYRADGLIFCTATGSTAYNLSAGGPIVHPRSSVITMTPICPHTLTNRSMVFPPGSVLRTSNLHPEAKPLITVDGSRAFADTNLPVTVRNCEQTVPLLQPEDYSHFRILRGKLMWGGEEGFDPSI